MMTPKQFAEYYDVNEATVGVFVHNHRASRYIVKTDNGTMIDNKFVEFVQISKKTLWLQAHDAYYQLQDFGISDSEQARTLAHLTKESVTSWQTFLNNGLFRLQQESITNVQHPQKLLKYLKAAQAMLHVIHRHNWQPTHHN